jgi:hypothetical protein
VNGARYDIISLLGRSVTLVTFHSVDASEIDCCVPRGMGPFVADAVAKVVNRTTPKISRKSIFRRLYLYNVPWRRYEGPWSFVCETMWSLTSAPAKRISGPKKFRSSVEKDFFNTIRQDQSFGLWLILSSGVAA